MSRNRTATLFLLRGLASLSSNTPIINPFLLTSQRHVLSSSFSSHAHSHSSSSSLPNKPSAQEKETISVNTNTSLATCSNDSDHDDGDDDLPSDVSTEELKQRIDKFMAGDGEAIPSIFEAILARKLSGKHEDTDDELMKQFQSETPQNNEEVESDNDFFDSDEDLSESDEEEDEDSG